jgi:hypothetical protein
MTYIDPHHSWFVVVAQRLAKNGVAGATRKSPVRGFCHLVHDFRANTVPSVPALTEPGVENQTGGFFE